MKCSGINSKGKPCKLDASNGNYCRYHCVTESSKEKEGKEGKELKENYRGVARELCYDNLGADCALNSYYLPGTRSEIYKKSDSIPYPENFTTVAKQLYDVCEKLDLGMHNCSVHPTMPGIQWVNNDDNTREAEQFFKEYMHDRGNHYFHKLNPAENTNFIKEDKDYCMCQEWKASNTAFLTLKGLTDEEWIQHHGSVYKIGDRKLTSTLKDKIFNDSINYLAQEYKIHLQVKPEYQIAVLEQLINLIKTDPEFLSIITAWKAIIPYDKVISEERLPSIVIYPVWGANNAQFAIRKIIETFSKYDIKKIGLNVTPRYNHKYDELIYWAGGSGDHKIFLDEKYFNNKEKNFYKGYEII